MSTFKSTNRKKNFSNPFGSLAEDAIRIPCVSHVFAESMTQCAAAFTNVNLITKITGYHIHRVWGFTTDVILQHLTDIAVVTCTLRTVKRSGFTEYVLKLPRWCKRHADLESTTFYKP